MVTDDDTRRIDRDFDRDRDQRRPDLETKDPVEDAIIAEMHDVKRALGEASLTVTRRQFETQLDALERKLDQHRWRRQRQGNLPGDPYHRTIDEVHAESARLGAHH